MHYKDGTEAKLGDVVQISPGSGSCNAAVLPIARRFTPGGAFYPAAAPYPDCCIDLGACSLLDTTPETALLPKTQ